MGSIVFIYNIKYGMDLRIMSSIAFDDASGHAVENSDKELQSKEVFGKKRWTCKQRNSAVKCLV